MVTKTAKLVVKKKAKTKEKTSISSKEMVMAKPDKDRVTVVAGGKVFKVKKGLAFNETVKAIAAKTKMAKFHVYVDGREAKSESDSPRDFGRVQEQVVMTTYDKGG